MFNHSNYLISKTFSKRISGPALWTVASLLLVLIPPRAQAEIGNSCRIRWPVRRRGRWEISHAEAGVQAEGGEGERERDGGFNIVWCWHHCLSVQAERQISPLKQTRQRGLIGTVIAFLVTLNQNRIMIKMPGTSPKKEIKQPYHSVHLFKAGVCMGTRSYYYCGNIKVLQVIVL